MIHIIEEVCTLTTSSRGKWVVGNVPGKVWSHGRPMTVQEKCRCCGVVPFTIAMLTNTEAFKAVGNTIPVPLIGAVIAAVMEAYMSSVASGSCISQDAIGLRLRV